MAYQKVTGIAGYTLVSDSRVIKLIAHEPFVSTEEAVRASGTAFHREIIRRAERRLCVGDTDRGREMREKIVDLKILLEAYNSGKIKER